MKGSSPKQFKLCAAAALYPATLLIGRRRRDKYSVETVAVDGDRPRSLANTYEYMCVKIEAEELPGIRRGSQLVARGRCISARV